MEATFPRPAGLLLRLICRLVGLFIAIHSPLALAQEPELDNLATDAAAAIFKSLRGSPLRTEVAVGDFAQKDDAITPLGVKLADEFSAALSKHARGFEVIDRATLTGTAPEYRTSPEDLADPNAAKCYGIRPDAAVIVLGTIDNLPDRVVLWIRVERLHAKIFDRRINLPLTPERRELLSEPRPVSEKLVWVSPDHPPIPNAAPVSAGTKNYGYPACVYCPQAQYSDVASTAKIQGAVEVDVVISADGFPASIAIVKGLPCGLSQRAIEAVKQWRFRPALGPDGKPAPVLQRIQVTFHLY
jgi:TonB family protein